MSSFQKFESLVEALAEKKHNLGADTLKVMLTLTAPLVTDAVKADLTEIAAGNGYSAGGTVATLVSSAQASGTYKLVLNDVVFTASGGSMAAFRYAVLYNDTASNDELIGFWDRGTSTTLLSGDTVTIDFDLTTGVIQIA